MIRYASDTAKLEAYQAGSWQNVLGGTASSAPLNGLSSATATNAIDNLTFAQNWNWSTATTQTPLSPRGEWFDHGCVALVDLVQRGSEFEPGAPQRRKHRDVDERRSGPSAVQRDRGFGPDRARQRERGRRFGHASAKARGRGKYQRDRVDELVPHQRKQRRRGPLDRVSGRRKFGRGNQYDRDSLQHQRWLPNPEQQRERGLTTRPSATTRSRPTPLGVTRRWEQVRLPPTTPAATTSASVSSRA